MLSDQCKNFNYSYLRLVAATDFQSVAALSGPSLLHRGFDVLLLKMYALDGNVRELCARR
jgi:hypothetical protein